VRPALHWRPRRWGHWTLRSRLVLVTAVLAGLALVVANLAGLLLIRSYLGDRIDEQLSAMARPFTTEVPFTVPPDGPSTRSPMGAFPGPKFMRPCPDHVMFLYGPDGELDAECSSAVGASRPDPGTFDTVLALADRGHPYTVTAPDGTSSWRLLATRAAFGGAVVIGLSLVEAQQTADRLLLIDVAVTVLVLVLLVLFATVVVRLGLRPLTSMERFAAEISAGNLSGRVSDTDPHTEPGRLGVALNLMLARIEAEVSARTGSEHRLRQFVADASHELRTPLTSIRGFAELYRRGGAPPGPLLDETMGRIEGEAGRMGVLVEDLLLLARLDRQRPPARHPVDLLEIAADTIRDAFARTPGRPVRLAGLQDDTETFDPPTVLGDDHGLRQVTTNLVANALQHTPADAHVTVRVGRVPAWTPDAGTVRSGPVPAGTGPFAVLEVTDDGAGVPPEHASRIFERLYRADASRTRGKGGGSGLGLSIVAAIVHRHQGWVELDSAPTGTTFRVLLPAVPLDGDNG
jgi:two-component system OmpR family sensor kinase